jgi:hypothetical protein
MASNEEVDITIRTIGDTSGAQQVTNALKQTQAAADQTQQQLGARGESANTVLRSPCRTVAVTGHSAGDRNGAAFRRVAPTLGGAFGIAALLHWRLRVDARSPSGAHARSDWLAARGGPHRSRRSAGARRSLRAQRQRQFDALIAERARTLGRARR